jgi:hypothetical protein
MIALDRARALRHAMPDGGLFGGMSWRSAVRPLALGPELASEIEALGRVFHQFYKAVNQLYRRSAEGRAPAWVAGVLDQGKPAELVALQRSAALRNELPRVIRPDLLLTDEGFIVSELDSVPGGIGLTQWLNQTYAALGEAVIGGASGMREGFESIFGAAPRVQIVVSDEAASYRPEMAWLASQAEGGRFQVHGGGFDAPADGDAVYRFFELFDLAQVPGSAALFRAALEKRIRLTPPPRPIFEEKLLFALLWNRNLREFWRQELGEGFYLRLLKIVPRSWLLDPEPLPPHAAYPGLEITEWSQLKSLSQRERALVLKISGFSPEAWGSRGVHLGSDLSAGEWGAAVDRALASWPKSPYILQRYHKPRLLQAEAMDLATGEVSAQAVRARLCPYYFVSGDGDQARPRLGGVLATLNPADKKIIHGMSDAILAPCSA